MKQDDRLQDKEWVSSLVDGQLRAEAFAQAVEAIEAHEDNMDAWHTYHLIGDVLRSAELAGGARDRAFLDRLRLRLDAEALPAVAPAVHAIDSVAAVAAGSDTAWDARPSGVGANPGSGMRAAQPSANDAGGRWKWVAGLASMAAVVAIAWPWLGGAGPDGALARQDTRTPAAVARANPEPSPSADAGSALRPDGSAAAVADSRRAAAAAGVVAAAAGPVTPAATVASNVGPAAAEAPVMLRDARLDELLAAHRQFGGTSALQMPAGFLRNATFENPGR